MRKDQCLASSVGPRVNPEDCARMLRIRACFVSLSFAGLVVLARSLNPIPSRTRPLNSSAPMVLWLKPWESRSLPGLPRTKQFLFACHEKTKRRFPIGRAAFLFLRRVARLNLRYDWPINTEFIVRSFHAPYLTSAGNSGVDLTFAPHPARVRIANVKS